MYFNKDMIEYYLYRYISKINFYFYKGGDEKEDSSIQKNDKKLEDGKDMNNRENKKRSEDIWSTDFAVSEQVILFF